MMVEQIKWDGEYKMQDFVSCFTKGLPVMVKTLSGLMGCDDLHIVGGDEIYWIYDIQRQKRIVTALKNQEQYCTIPVDHPAKFNMYIYDKNAWTKFRELSPILTARGAFFKVKRKLSEKASQLQELLPIINQNEQNVYIECENNDKLHFQFGSEDGNHARFGLMEVLDVYDEKYLLGYPICANKINASSCGIPVYLDIELTVAVDFNERPTECFKSWLRLIHNIAKTFPKIPVKMCQEIIIFSKCPNDGLYEYINPIDSKLTFEDVKSSFSDYSKVNPYVIQPPPRLHADPQTPKSRSVDLPDIPKRLPPALPPMPQDLEGDSNNDVSSQPEICNPEKSKKLPKLKITLRPDVIENSSSSHEPVKPLTPNTPQSAVAATPRKCMQNKTLSTSTSPTLPSEQKLSSVPETSTCQSINTPSEKYKDDIKSYNMKDVQECLQLLNMSSYAEMFFERQVDGELLSCMDVDLLVNEFKLSRFDALKLCKFVNGWRPAMI